MKAFDETTGSLCSEMKIEKMFVVAYVWIVLLPLAQE